MVETPEKIVIYTNTDKYSIRKTDIKFQKLSLIKLTKLKWKIGVSVNGNKIKIFYIIYYIYNNIKYIFMILLFS